jgi:hypothetical protein
METVHFFTAPGIRLAADVYFPPGSPPAAGYPAIVVCLGWGSVKELMANWGEALAELGYLVIVPDYRGFGASGGERGQCFPEEHIDDIGVALTYIAQLPETDADRLALLGVSYGGAIAVATGGKDRRPRAVISIVGYGSGERHLRAVRTDAQWAEFRIRLKKDGLQRMLTGRSEDIDPDEILLRDEEARSWRRAMEARYPHMAFRTTLESAQKIVDFVPERSLPFASPTGALFIHAADDSMVPVDESTVMWNRADEPKKRVIIPGIGHHQVHTGEAFQLVIGHVDSWLDEHLATPR